MTSLGEVNDLMKHKGYGLYGVGIYGHNTGDLNKAIEILGPDILEMPMIKIHKIWSNRHCSCIIY